MPITIQDVIDTFDSFGDNVVHNQALQSRLRESGFDIQEIVSSINEAIESGILSSNSVGEIRKT